MYLSHDICLSTSRQFSKVYWQAPLNTIPVKWESSWVGGWGMFLALALVVSACPCLHYLCMALQLSLSLSLLPTPLPVPPAPLLLLIQHSFSSWVSVLPAGFYMYNLTCSKVSSILFWHVHLIPSWQHSPPLSFIGLFSWWPPLNTVP